MRGSWWLRVGLVLALTVGAVGGAAAQLPAAVDDPAVADETSMDGVVQGVVEDASGAVVPGARVTLVTAKGRKLETVTGADGSFVFQNVWAGSFTVRVSGVGLETESVMGVAGGDSGGTLTELPAVVLQMATVSMEVNAISQWQAAEYQIHDEEKQRLLWVLPNFYVSYVQDAAPLTTGQKFRLASRSVIDPEVIVSAGVTAGIEQGLKQYQGFGQGAAGFGRRYAANYGDSFIGIYLGGAVLPTLFHQDPRYFYKGTGGFRARLWYVVTRAVVQKGDNGKWQPAYSNVLGDLGSALLSDAYYPVKVHNWGALTAETFGISIAGDSVGNLLQEFVYARWTSRKK